jgi:hypothetical protein
MSAELQDRLAQAHGIEVSPSALLGDFQSLGLKTAEAERLDAVSVELRMAARRAVSSCDGEFYTMGLDDFSPDDPALIEYYNRAAEAHIASEQAHEARVERQRAESTLVSIIDLYYRGRDVAVSAVEEGDTPIKAMAVRSGAFVVRKALEVVEGKIELSTLERAELRLRPTSLFSRIRNDHYQVTMVTKNNEPRVKMKFI